MGILSEKLYELKDTMLRRKVNTMCFQETKCVGDRSSEIERSGFKIWYAGKNKHRNGAGVVVEKILRKNGKRH